MSVFRGIVQVQLPGSAAFLYDQPHTLQAVAVFRAGRDDIDPNGIDAIVSKDIGQLGDVLFRTVEHPGKQVPQIMREHFLRLHARLFAQRLHLPSAARRAFLVFSLSAAAERFPHGA